MANPCCRTPLPDPRRTPRFAGITTFARFPVLEAVPPERGPVDWVVYGVPFDTGVTYRPGARFGPRAIRNESQYIKPYHVEHDITLTDVFSLADAGDSPVTPYSCPQNAETVADFARVLADPDRTRLFALGGDHSIALPNLRATVERCGRPTGGLALIHFDSHVDTIDTTFDERYSHASPFIRAIEEGVVDPKRMISIGIKGPLNSSKELDFAREHGITIVKREDLLRDGTRTIDAFLKRVGGAPCYLSYDIDVLDPVFAPGTGTPSVGGLTTTEALALLRRLATGGEDGKVRPPNIVGADLVEVLPDRDVAGNTALIAAHIVFEILCLDALRRVRG